MASLCRPVGAGFPGAPRVPGLTPWAIDFRRDAARTDLRLLLSEMPEKTVSPGQFPGLISRPAFDTHVYVSVSPRAVNLRQSNHAFSGGKLPAGIYASSNSRNPGNASVNARTSGGTTSCSFAEWPVTAVAAGLPSCPNPLSKHDLRHIPPIEKMRRSAKGGREFRPRRRPARTFAAELLATTRFATFGHPPESRVSAFRPNCMPTKIGRPHRNC